jgi:hypothetical protein
VRFARTFAAVFAREWRVNLRGYRIGLAGYASFGNLAPSTAQRLYRRDRCHRTYSFRAARECRERVNSA